MQRSPLARMSIHPSLSTVASSADRWPSLSVTGTLVDHRTVRFDGGFVFSATLLNNKERGRVFWLDEHRASTQPLSS
jgi:hypothetical protein